jgi:hypothetical protein
MLASFTEILDLFTIADLAAALRLKYPTAAAMKQRRWIDAAHWQTLIDAVRARGEYLDAAMLVRFAHERAMLEIRGRRTARIAAPSRKSTLSAQSRATRRKSQPPTGPPL